MPAPKEPTIGPKGETALTTDPTALTTAALDKALSALKELVNVQITGLEKIQTIQQEALNAIETAITKQVLHLEALHAEKFSGVEKQFLERDKRTEQLAIVANTAISAALQAAKEAVGKQQEATNEATQKAELSTTKQIDGLGALINTNNRSIELQINDMKERLTRIEGLGAGADKNTAQSQASGGYIVAIVGSVVGALILAVAVAALIVSFMKH